MTEMVNWREVVKAWVEKHGCPTTPLARAHVDQIPFWWDTSGSVNMDEFNRKARQRQDRMDHVNRTIANYFSTIYPKERA